ncbi:hypothetical protein [Kitasatospora sp. NPDC001132]
MGLIGLCCSVDEGVCAAQRQEVGGWSTAADLAKQTKEQGYGIYNTYRLPDTDVSKGLSAVTKILYNSDVRPPGATEPAP